MKKIYNCPELNIIAFEQGDILAAISIVPDTGAADGSNEGFIGWGDNVESSGGDVKNFFG